MDFGRKLEELNMTTDEINRLSKAMKDKKFCELLHEYVEEISNPENKKKYEEEMTELERERGIEVKFIHPHAHHVLKTSVNGKEKCFINICSNELINKPSCESRRNDEGRGGQYWSIPYSLTPGRSHTDGKNNKCTIYDVVFHPDTLYMAGKNAGFMKVVHDTATRGMEEAFNVTIDKSKTLLKKLQYKGVPQAAVIRKPVPGQNKESTAGDQAFPLLYPDTKPTEDLKPLSSSQTQTTAGQSCSPTTQPHYTIKYRSVVDLQDYRCSRDSAPSTRPKQIVISVDLPLLNSAADLDLNVTDRKLTLESQKPDYKLELHLSYPVDDEKGRAKFNKTTKQLTITLAVQPPEKPAAVDTENIQPEPGPEDVSGSADQANEAETLTDEQRELKISDPLCEAQPQEKDELFSSDKTQSHTTNSLQSKFNPLHLTEADPTLTSQINTNTSSVNAGDGATNTFLLNTSTHKFPANKQAEKNQNTENLPSGISSDQASDMVAAETGEKCAPEVPVVEFLMKQTQLEEVFHDIHKSSAESSSRVRGTSEVQPSAVCDEANQLNSSLDTSLTSRRAEETTEMSEEKNSTKHISTRTVQNKRVDDDDDSSKQTSTDFTSTSSPAALPEKNPEDGSEVIITDQKTSSALCFQNSLWFELD